MDENDELSEATIDEVMDKIKTEMAVFQPHEDAFPIRNREDFVDYYMDKLFRYVEGETEEEQIKNAAEETDRSIESIRKQHEEAREHISGQAKEVAKDIESLYDDLGRTLYPITEDHELVAENPYIPEEYREKLN